jgi:hypothetical protein
MKADLNEERGLAPVDVLVRESSAPSSQSLQLSGAIAVYLTVC